VNATVRLGGWEGAGSRVNHEPEDLPGELTDVPSWAGELARMSCGCNPQGLSRPWGFFYLGSGVFRTRRWVGFLLGVEPYDLFLFGESEESEKALRKGIEKMVREVDREKLQLYFVVMRKILQLT